MAMWCPRQLATITDQQTHFQTLNTKLFHQQEHLTKHLKQQINIADLPDINMDQLSQMARQAVSKRWVEIPKEETTPVWDPQ
ncbi:MAG: hypothetical protein OXM62_05050, partial [bacterium]|nr:hypothetical protein [bacterium]